MPTIPGSNEKWPGRFYDRGGAVFNVMHPEFGAVGNGITDDTAACRLAFVAAESVQGTVLFPSGYSFKFTDQLHTKVGVSVYAYGATLKWTKFGSVLAAGAAHAQSTGNAIRMESRTRWYGGTLIMDGVPNPADISVPAAIVSGNFWNQFAIGHFNDGTSDTVSAVTEDVEIADLQLILASGEMFHEIFMGGHVRNIRCRNITYDDNSTTTSEKVFFEATWGTDSTFTYHPHNLIVENITVRDYKDSPTSPTTISRGFHFAGCYDVKCRNIRITDCFKPFAFYIGDPGDPGGTPDPVNADQAGKICTGLELDGYVADNFDMGIAIIGDANGSTHSERGTHAVRCIIKNIYLKGQGPIAGLGAWSSNYGIWAMESSRWQVIGGEIKDCLYGIQQTAPQASVEFTAVDGVRIQNLEIHNMARDGLNLGTAMRGAVVRDNNIYDVAQVSGSWAAIRMGGGDNVVEGNQLGRPGDVTSDYGYFGVPGPTAKLTPGNNRLSRNHVFASVAASYIGDEYDLDETNTMDTGWSAGGVGVVPLTDAATIATNMRLGCAFGVTLSGNRTMGNPTNPIPGKIITYHITQDGTGARTLAWGSEFKHAWSDTGNTSGKKSVISFRRHDTAATWEQVGAQTPYYSP